MTLMNRNKSRSKNLIQTQKVIRLRQLRRQDLLLWMRRTRSYNGLTREDWNHRLRVFLDTNTDFCKLLVELWG